MQSSNIPFQKSNKLFQSAPKSSPLTFTLDGDASINQWEVSQNAADDKSPLSCTPDCPQVEYVEEENDFNSEDNTNNSNEDNNVVQNGNEETNFNAEQDQKTSFLPLESNSQSFDSMSSQTQVDQGVDQGDEDFEQADLQNEAEHQQQHQQTFSSDTFASINSKSCPGANIDDCIEVCPASPPLAFKYCVAECGKRCP